MIVIAMFKAHGFARGKSVRAEPIYAMCIPDCNHTQALRRASRAARSGEFASECGSIAATSRSTQVRALSALSRFYVRACL
jgi:hypothetical protein